MLLHERGKEKEKKSGKYGTKKNVGSTLEGKRKGKKKKVGSKVHKKKCGKQAHKKKREKQDM